jgi:predicted nuclease of predicted toxin-antitoxin system
MRILIDECLPRRLKGELPGHTVSTVPEMTGSGKKNGELVELIAGDFDVFITVDQNMIYQQNLAGLSFAVIVLSASSNTLAGLTALMPQVAAALATIQPGDVVTVSRPATDTD